MNETRKKIILNELKYWKKTKMLPEKYCDYLIALYSEGDGQEKKHQLPQPATLLFAFIGLIFVAVVIVNYFTELGGTLQIAFYLFCMLLLIGIIFFNQNNGNLRTATLLALAFILVLATVSMWKKLAPGNSFILYLGLIVNCLLWLFAGVKMRMLYFTLAGSFGILVVFFYICSFIGIV